MKIASFWELALEPLFQIEYVENVLYGVESLLLHGTPDLIILTEVPKRNQLFCKYLRKKVLFEEVPILSIYQQSPLESDLDKACYSLIYPFTSACLYKKLGEILAFKIQLPTDYLDAIDPILSRYYLGYQQSPEELWIEQFYHSIDPMLKQFGLTLQEVANEMCISLPHLHRKVKDITQKTPMALIKERRLQKAMEALKENPHTRVKYVAYSVGYKSVKNFSKNFKSRFGSKPSDFLKK
ncbi:MAG: helix-turn-helix domain-containing protein [Bacteroidia bacterium]